MCTLARPVRVAARLAWKVATAPSMRRLRSALRSLSAGIPAMMKLPLVSSSLTDCQRLFYNIRNRGGYDRQPGGCGLLVGVVAGADQRAGFDVAEAHFEGFGLELGKLARRVEAGHGQVVARGAQILADGEDVAVTAARSRKTWSSSCGLFAEADHDAGFGEPVGPQLFGVAQELKVRS
jgi:hypothetical protein